MKTVVSSISWRYVGITSEKVCFPATVTPTLFVSFQLWLQLLIRTRQGQTLQLWLFMRSERPAFTFHDQPRR